MPLTPIEPTSLADYLEALSRPVFQGGLRWSVVDAKWPALRDAFHGFDPEWVASLSPDDIEDLLGDRRVIRHRAKIEGTVVNAQTLLRLDRAHHGFRRYLRSHAGYGPRSADLRQKFRFLGEQGAYQFLVTVGEEVPAYADWAAAHGLAAEPKG
jgi:3-methyladenine DNA glycosylase Tag